MEERTNHISVVIPTRERLELVARAVRSVQEQSHSNWSAVIVDDSSEDTFRELRMLSQEDPRIRVIRGPRGGDAVARRIGASSAEGPLIAFLDSDDEWLPHHLSEHITLWSRFPTIGLSWNADVVFTGDGKLRLPFDYPFRRGVTCLQPTELVSRLLVRNVIDISSSVISKQLLERAGGFPLRQPCDWRLWIALTQLAPAVYTSKILTVHHEAAIGRLGYSRRVRIRDTIGTYSFGLETLKKLNLNVDPSIVFAWSYQRLIDFFASGLPKSAIASLKRLTKYYVDCDPSVLGVELSEWKKLQT